MVKEGQGGQGRESAVVRGAGEASECLLQGRRWNAGGRAEAGMTPGFWLRGEWTCRLPRRGLRRKSEFRD